MQYPAIITKEGEFTLAEFPDCPGCQTFTREGEDIEASAKEALEGWLEANLGRDSVPNRPGTERISKGAEVKAISVPLTLAFRLALRWARAESGKTQAQFGKMLEMTQQQYARLEGAGSNPTLETIDRVAPRAGVDVSVSKGTKILVFEARVARTHATHRPVSQSKAAGVLRSKNAGRTVAAAALGQRPGEKRSPRRK